MLGDVENTETVIQWKTVTIHHSEVTTPGAGEMDASMKS